MGELPPAWVALTGVITGGASVSQWFAPFPLSPAAPLGGSELAGPQAEALPRLSSSVQGLAAWETAPLLSTSSSGGRRR